MICQKTIFSFDQWISRDTSFLFHKDFITIKYNRLKRRHIHVSSHHISNNFFNTLNDLYDECLSFTLGHWIRLCFETPVKKILFVELSLNFSISDKGRHIFIWLALIFICIPRFIDKTRLSFLIQSYIECKNKLSIIW